MNIKKTRPQLRSFGGQAGFTLVELLIVMSIVIILAIMMIGIFNAAGIMNKGRDAQRKKDLNRIKVAFEEYFNDKGEFPTGTLLADLNDKNNCGSTSIFAPYLIPWPCDPNKNPYAIIVEKNRFRIITNLENKKDKDIPAYWYERNDVIVTGFDRDQVNYGVSSANILWYDTIIDPVCDRDNCAAKNIDGSGGCNSVVSCTGQNCYYRNSGFCTDNCWTPCCGSGCGF